MDLPENGPVPLSFTWEKLQGVKLKGKPTPNVAAHHQMDEVFSMELSWWSGTVTLKQAFVVTEPNYAIEGYLEYMACNDKNCLAPSSESFNFKGTANIAADKADKNTVETVAETPAQTDVVADTAAAPDTAGTAVAASAPVAQSDLWAPVCQ